MLDLIDTHCHFDSFIKHNSLDSVLEYAFTLQVRRMIAIGTSMTDWSLYQELAQSNPKHIRYTVGIHPCYVDESWEEQIQLLSPFFTQLLQPLAIGEIGLDYFHLPKNTATAQIQKNLQEEAFKHQLALALQFDSPIIIHSRNAFWETVKMIDNSQVDWSKVVFHCFSEGPEEIKALNERGARGSFTGIITYKNADKIRAAALQQGLDRLMLETDSPYLPPEPLRSERNQPANIRLIAEYCANYLFKMPLPDFGQHVTRNSEQFFRWH